MSRPGPQPRPSRADSAQGSLPGPVLETVRETFALIQLPGGRPLPRHLAVARRCRCPPGNGRGILTARLDTELPEPLATVREREEEQRVQVRNLLQQWEEEQEEEDANP